MGLKISQKTAEITVPSGVKFIIKQLVGRHQKMLTKSRIDMNDKFNNVLADIIIDIEGVEWEKMKPLSRKAFVRKMLAADRKYILTEARQLSKGYDPTFEFKQEWKDSKGVKQHKLFEIHLLDEANREEIVNNIKKEYDEDLHDAIDKLNRLGCFPTKPYRRQFSTYAEVRENRDIIFSGEDQLKGFEFTFRLLDGAMEEKIDKDNLSSHTKIMCRLPRWRSVAQKGKDVKPDTWKRLTEEELDDLPPEYVDFIRNKITFHEGDIDTVDTLDNPDTSSDKPQLTVDLMGEITFFFPSGQI